MRKIDFRLCDCGTLPPHGHVCIDGARFLEVPIWWVNIAEITFLNDLVDNDVISADLAKDLKNQMINAGLLEYSNLEEEKSAQELCEAGIGGIFSAMFSLRLM